MPFTYITQKSRFLYKIVRNFAVLLITFFEMAQKKGRGMPRPTTAPHQATAHHIHPRLEVRIPLYIDLILNFR